MSKPYKAIAFNDRGGVPAVVDQAAFAGLRPALQASVRFAKHAGKYGERHVTRIVIMKHKTLMADCEPRLTRRRGPARDGHGVKQYAKCVFTPEGRKALARQRRR